jgi:hypothetical protein
MSNPATIVQAGVATVYGGNAGVLRIEGECEIQPLARVRETKQGHQGPAGFGWIPATPYLQITVYKGQNLTLDQIYAVEGNLIQVDLEDGSVYRFPFAWQVGELPLNALEGTVPVRFEAFKCDESGAS